MQSAANQEIATIDDYIRQFSAEIQALLNTLRATIRQAAPEASEKISYRSPTFHYHGNLVHFAAFARHIGFYPGASGIAAFRDQFGQYPHAKGSVQFPLGEPLPLGLVAQIVKFRVRETDEKARSRSATPKREKPPRPRPGSTARRPEAAPRSSRS